MKKVLIVILFILVILGCLSIPSKYALKDGGTIVHKAVLWEHYDYHTLPNSKGKSLRGSLLKICGITVKDNTKWVKIEKDVNSSIGNENDKYAKETRYYQYSTESQETDENGTSKLKYYEIQLNTDGTAKVDFYRVLDVTPKEGIYVENDKYIILTLNSTSSECYEGNYEPKIADGCSDTIILIKDGDELKQQVGSIYHFEIDNVNNTYEYVQVKKSNLKTGLKN